MSTDKHTQQIKQSPNMEINAIYNLSPISRSDTAGVGSQPPDKKKLDKKLAAIGREITSKEADLVSVFRYLVTCKMPYSDTILCYNSYGCYDNVYFPT